MLKNLLFCSLVWNLDGPKTRKGPFDFHISSIFKFPTKTTGLNSPEKISVEIISSKFGFILKLIGCMYDQSCLRSIDGKQRSATALLVCCSIELSERHNLKPKK